MRRIVVFMSVSVDGFMSGPDGKLEWQLVDDEPHRHFNDELRGMGGFLDGRVTYELTLAREVVAADIVRLQHWPGGDLVLGGADLAATFLRLDLIDEFRLYVHPVLLGRGRPLFPTPGVPMNLVLAQSRTFGSGVVLLRYLRSDPAPVAAPVAGD